MCVSWWWQFLPSSDARFFENCDASLWLGGRSRPLQHSDQSRGRHLLPRSCATSASSWPTFSAQGRGSECCDARVQVWCPKLQIQRELKADETLAAKDTTPSGSNRRRIDDLSAMRMRPYMQGKDDVAHCIIIGMRWNSALHYYGTVGTLVQGAACVTRDGHCRHRLHHRQNHVVSHRCHQGPPPYETAERRGESHTKRRQLCAERARKQA